MCNSKSLLQKKGFLVILSSPSGGGKTTIYKALLERNPDFTYSVSHTTRKKRSIETDGVDYRFVTVGEFDKLRTKSAFVEWANVHGNIYGTTRKTIEESLTSDRITIFDLDVQGAAKIKSDFGDRAVMIFILPPSYEELQERLCSRHTDTKADVELRLKNALSEFDRIREYDYVVINDDIERSIVDIEKIIHSESLRLDRIEDIYWKGQ